MSGDQIRTYFRKKCLKKGRKHDILNVSDKWKKFVLGEEVWEKAIHMMRTVFPFWKVGGCAQKMDYIGSVSTKGLNHLIYEIVDNAVDEHLAGFCKNIHVTLEKDGSATVEDDGRGVPVGMHQKGISRACLVYTTLHAGGKFDDSAYKTKRKTAWGRVLVVNALSIYMDVQISREGYIHHDRYERGIPVVDWKTGFSKDRKDKKNRDKGELLPIHHF